MLNPSLQRTCASCAGWSAEFKRYASQQLLMCIHRRFLVAAFVVALSVHMPAFAQSKVEIPEDVLDLVRQGQHDAAARELSPRQARTLGVAFAARNRFSEALPYLLSASNQGYRTAQLELAFLLASSDPPVRNLVEAYAWAAQNLDAPGNDGKFAEDIVAQARRTLSQAELGRAQTRALELRSLLASASPK